MMKPSVLHFILCDDARPDPHNLHKINVYGITMKIRSGRGPAVPIAHPLLSAFAVLRGGRGIGEFLIRIVQEDTGLVIYQSKKLHRVQFVGSLSEVKAFVMRLPSCRFPHEGVYWVELVLSGEELARQPLRVST